MKITAMLSVIPIGTELSLSKYVAACERVLLEAGLSCELHAHGTNVEGEWEDVMDAVRRSIETIHAMGCARLSVFLKIGSRTDRDPDGAAAVRSVRAKLGPAT
jgi:uncharacterized protein (TIGR00106 family)